MGNLAPFPSGGIVWSIKVPTKIFGQHVVYLTAVSYARLRGSGWLIVWSHLYGNLEGVSQDCGRRLGLEAT